VPPQSIWLPTLPVHRDPTRQSLLTLRRWYAARTAQRTVLYLCALQFTFSR
jgi:hypothetical protein